MPANDAKSKMLKDQMGSFKSGKAGGRGGRGGKPAAKGGRGRGGGGGGKAVRERRNTEFLEKLNAYEVGAEYWVSDPKVVWKLCKCTAFDNWKVTVQFEDGATKTIDLRYDDCFRKNPRCVDDMTSLHEMHEPGIMHNCELRAQCDLSKKPGEDGQQPYTYVQNVLVAINPLRRVPHPPKTNYPGKKLMDVAPHPFGIAENSFQRLSSTVVGADNQNQSIVISGESGAGKTETTKICLAYLTQRSGAGLADESLAAAETTPDGKRKLDRKILDSNPILENWGNAKTTRNGNSSRFGKFMILQYSNDKRFTLAGATLETYLLEKSRIVHQGAGERNYHLFYMFWAILSDAEKQELELYDPRYYRYTNGSGVYTVGPSWDDHEEGTAWMSAMTQIGVSTKDIMSVKQMITGILSLGNVEFDNKSTSAGDEADPKDPAWVARAAKSFGVDVGAMQKCLVEQMRLIKGEVFFSQRDAKQAAFARDAISKTLYQMMFDWIVKVVADSFDRGPDDLPFIGILDIFGFETFPKNDFEQLLINLANESLQGVFNDAVLAAEMQLYKEEQIHVEPIKFDANDKCVDLLLGKPKGILCQLVATAQAPQPNDTKFVAALHKLHEGHPFFPRPHPKDIRNTFIVKHFAAEVPYTAGSFIDKNNDEVPPDLIELVESSAHDFMQSEAKLAGSGKKAKHVTVTYSKQMTGLKDKLQSTQCNFVRCIKPNAEMKAGVFDRHYSVEQMRFLGVLNTCKVLKLGLPSRVGYEHVGEPLRAALPAALKAKFTRYGPKKVTYAVLWAAEIPWDDYRLGRTLCFFRAGKIGQLDKIMKMNINSAEGAVFCARLEKWLIRQKWKWAYALQCDLMAATWLLELIRKKPPMAKRLQTYFRMYLARKAYRAKRERVRQWQMCYLYMRMCKIWQDHYQYVHDNKAVMLLKQKEIKRKRLLLRLRGNVGDKKKETEGARKTEGREETDVDRQLKARIKSQLSKGSRHRRFIRQALEVAGAGDDSATISAIKELNLAIKAM